MANLSTDLNTLINVRSNLDRRNEFSFWQIILVLVGIVVILVLLAFNRTITRFQSIFQFYNGTADALKRLQSKNPGGPDNKGFTDVLLGHEQCCDQGEGSNINALGFSLDVGWRSVAGIVPSDPATSNGARLSYDLVSSYLIASKSLLCGPLIFLNNDGSKSENNAERLKHFYSQVYSTKGQSKKAMQWQWAGGMWCWDDSKSKYSFVAADKSPPPCFVETAPTPDSIGYHYEQALCVANPLYYLFRADDLIGYNTGGTPFPCSGCDGVANLKSDRCPSKYLCDVAGDTISTTGGIWEYIGSRPNETVDDLFAILLSPQDKGCTSGLTTASDFFGGAVSFGMAGAMAGQLLPETTATLFGIGPLGWIVGVATLIGGGLAMAGDLAGNASKNC